MVCVAVKHHLKKKKKKKKKNGALFRLAKSLGIAASAVQRTGRARERITAVKKLQRCNSYVVIGNC